jgi:hypothetical protein
MRQKGRPVDLAYAAFEQPSDFVHAKVGIRGTCFDDRLLVIGIWVSAPPAGTVTFSLHIYGRIVNFPNRPSSAACGKEAARWTFSS